MFCKKGVLFCHASLFWTMVDLFCTQRLLLLLLFSQIILPEIRTERIRSPRNSAVLVPSQSSSQSFTIFLKKIKKWMPLQCPCRLCKIYLQHVGFIKWTPENSLHRNGGVLLSVSLIIVWTDVCMSASLFTLVWEILSGKIASPVQWSELTSISSMLLL